MRPQLALSRETEQMRTARNLILITLLYNIGEGAVAFWSGLEAGSLSLIAFGADSYVEVAAAAVVFWRLGVRDPEEAELAERKALRFIGLTFLLVAAAIIVESSIAIAGSDGASESLAGIALAAASVVVMPVIAVWKMKVATEGRIFALAAEAKETLACSYLSLTLLAGLVANAVLGWWWLDAATALLLTPWLIREGLEGIRGEHDDEHAQLCWCRRCLYGLKSCQSSCCATV